MGRRPILTVQGAFGAAIFMVGKDLVFPAQDKLREVPRLAHFQVGVIREPPRTPTAHVFVDEGRLVCGVPNFPRGSPFLSVKGRFVCVQLLT